MGGKLMARTVSTTGNISATDNNDLSKKKGFVWNLKAIKRDWQLYSLVLIPVIYFIIFKYVPMVGNIIAFRKYVPGQSIFGVRWVGLKYFKMFMGDPNFWHIFLNTLKINLMSLVIGFPFPIIFALLLNEVGNRFFKKTIQTITYMPHFLSMVVVVGMIEDFLDPTSGFLNQIVKMRTGHTIYFMQTPSAFLPTYIISDLWQNTGWNSIIYLAALTGIDPGLYEAAEIDGAGRWKQTLHVTIPGILPTISIMLILSIGGLLGGSFEKILLMQNPVIQDASDILSTYLYRIGITQNSFSYGTAIGLFDAVIGFILIFISNRFSKKFTESSLW
jgi:putative aldouronate transport system permease protein